MFTLFGGQTGSFGLQGIFDGLRLQQGIQDRFDNELESAVNRINVASQFDQLDQFAANARAGLDPSANLFRTAQTSLNPLTAQSGLNNFINRGALLGPLASRAAQQGNTGLFNSLVGPTGGQFVPGDPTSGFELQGAAGQANQARAAIQNTLSGGQLFQPQAIPQAVAPSAVPVAQAPAGQVFGDLPQAPVAQAPAAAAVSNVQDNSTQVQRNAAAIEQVNAALQNFPSTSRDSTSAVRQQSQTPIQQAESFATTNDTRDFQLEEDRRRRNRLQSNRSNTFSSIFSSIF